MIIVDRALEARQNNPVRVGMVGAGFMAQGITNQIVNSVPGMTLAAISNRTLDKATEVYAQAGVESVTVSSQAALADAVAQSRPAVTEDAMLLARASNLDAIIEVTGALEFSAHVVLEAINHGKHVILMNAELDGTVGAILKVYADRAGVILTACDGDQPGVQMNLYRFVKSIGLTPLLCGNIKGLQDPYRNPTTQEGFAKRWGQNPYMVTSFADGTKISFEQAIVANATGMTVAKRGMLGYDFDGHIDDATKLYDVDELKRLGGIVDYVVGSKPGPGVFVFASHDDPKQQHYLNLYKLGEGPLYSFYTPYHLCHFEVPLSVARAVLLNDAVMQPLGAPHVEVVAIAKRELKAGETLDKLGGYLTYGVCERADVTAQENLLPMGVAENCVLTRDIPQDQALTYADVRLPEGRLIDQLRYEQRDYFAKSPQTDQPITLRHAPQEAIPARPESTPQPQVEVSEYTPTVSILMATYNYGRFIEDAVKRVLSQTYGNFKLIIGDNASTDDTEARLKPYLEDARVHYFRNDDNVGITENFNRCFRAMPAESRYFIGLPADDYWQETLLEQLVTIAEANPDVAITYSNGYRFEDPNEGSGDVYGYYTDIFTTPMPPPGKHRALRELYENNYIPFQAALVSVGQFRLLYPYVDPYIDTVPHVHDHHLWLQLLSQGGIAYFHDQPLVHIRKHGSAMTMESNIITRLEQERWLLAHVQEVTPRALEPKRLLEQQNRSKRLLFKLLETERLSEAQEVLADLLPQRRDRDIRLVRWLLALPVSAPAKVRLWRTITYVYQYNANIRRPPQSKQTT
jgi:predicted homoserine dehydrogenase-like protein